MQDIEKDINNNLIVHDAIHVHGSMLQVQEFQLA
jgi:hypothetical protein